jgi:hypothetical protein
VRAIGCHPSFTEQADHSSFSTLQVLRIAVILSTGGRILDACTNKEATAAIGLINLKGDWHAG